MFNTVRYKALTSASFFPAQRIYSILRAALPPDPPICNTPEIVLKRPSNPLSSRLLSASSYSRCQAPSSDASRNTKHDPSDSASPATRLENSSEVDALPAEVKAKPKRVKKKKIKEEVLEPEKRWPHEIVWLKEKKSLRVNFDDGKSFLYPAELLRVESPSAESTRRTIAGRRHVNIMKLEPVGNYALSIKFDDTHETGIYSWPFLYMLGVEKIRRIKSYIRKLREEGLSRDPPRGQQGLLANTKAGGKKEGTGKKGGPPKESRSKRGKKDDT